MKKLLSLVFALIVLLPFGYAAGFYYAAASGGGVVVDEFSVCRGVENANSVEIMIPTSTSTEWSTGGSSFLENIPSGVTIYDTCLGCSGDSVQTLNCDSSGCSYSYDDCGNKDCDTNNNYHIYPANSASAVNYCYYRDYHDKNRVCSDGACSDPACSTYDDIEKGTAGVCYYFTTCTSSPSTTAYSDDTSCGTNYECTSTGSCNRACSSWAGDRTRCEPQATEVRVGTVTSESLCADLCEEQNAICCGYSTNDNSCRAYWDSGVHILTGTNTGKSATMCG